MIVASIVVNSLPPIQIVDSPWAIGAALTSALVGFGTIALAVVTWRLSRATVRANSLEQLREQRAARPILVAFIDPQPEDTDEVGEPYQYRVKIQNKGAVALFVSVFGQSENGDSMAETNTIQVVGAGETIATRITVFELNKYVRRVRIRYRDVFENSYITAYKSLGLGLIYPTFRLPWLGKELGEAKPARWSGQVSWKVEHFERQIGVAYELLEPNDAKVVFPAFE